MLAATLCLIDVELNTLLKILLFSKSNIKACGPQLFLMVGSLLSISQIAKTAKTE